MKGSLPPILAPLKKFSPKYVVTLQIADTAPPRQGIPIAQALDSRRRSSPALRGGHMGRLPHTTMHRLERMSRLQVTYDYTPDLVLHNFEVLKAWQDEALRFGNNDQPVEM